MSVFAYYARYYDLLYKDKDYSGEACFVSDLIKEFAPEARTILELGCGTGIHAKLLAEAGYELHGIDNSAEMLAAARGRLHDMKQELAERLSFSHGDARTARIDKKFDVVISLFHVMSYQVTNDDLLAAVETAKVHLKPGGIFIFDCWYGPAVLTDRPVVRVKRLEDEAISVTRIAEPVMHPNNNIVDVNYRVLIKDKTNNTHEELRETHRMRYLFKPELEYYLSAHQMSIEKCVEWMSTKETGFDTWNACFVARA
jgi:SAM-dependent methyltransferase